MNTLHVKPDLIRNKAKDVQQYVDKMRKDFNNLQTVLNSTHSYWKGQAGDLHRKLYNEKVEEVEKVLKLMESYPVDILKIFGLYVKNEERGKVVAKSLKSNIIQ